MIDQRRMHHIIVRRVEKMGLVSLQEVMVLETVEVMSLEETDPGAGSVSLCTILRNGVSNAFRILIPVHMSSINALLKQDRTVV